MTWGAVAVAGATVVGGYMAAESASDDRAAASAMSAAQLAFEKEKHQDWKDTYGSIEDNLAEYYNNLTPEYYATQGLEAVQKESEATRMRLKTSLAQRGIEDSGVSLALEQQSDIGLAEQRATVRADAPRKAMEEKRGFLQVGLGQNPGSSLSTTMANQASQASARADASERAAGQGVATAITAVGSALDDYANRPTTPTQTTTSLPSSYVSTTNQNVYDYSGHA